MIRALMDSLPLWGALLVTIGIVLTSNELGFRMGTYRRDTREKDAPPQVVSMTGAHVGLLAFILAFSFSLAAGHYSQRKQVVLEEVNAIQTAYLRAGLVGAPEDGNIMALLATYSSTLASLGTPESIAGVLKESQVIENQIWAEIKAISEKEKLSPFDSLLVQSINNVFELREKRIFAGLHSRIPADIWVALYAVLILSMLGMGFSAGLAAKRSPVASLALALSFSMVMYVIADLDRPAAGMMRADQSLMVDLAHRLNHTDE